MMGVCDANGYCIPNVDDVSRPKGVSIIFQSVLEYDIHSQFRDSSSVQSDEIEQNESVEIKLKFPLILKDRYKMAMGLVYKKEEYEFDDPEESQNLFHRHLEEKPLRSIGTTFYLDKRFKGRHYLYSRVGLFLNGDFNSGPLEDYFRSSITVLYGTKVNTWKTWSIGLSYSYNFGRLALYPVLQYNKQFNEHWGFEMALPVKTEFRYILNPKNYFFFVNRLGGDNYILNFDGLSDNSLYLGKADFISMLTYEREIHDFLWFTVSVGLRYNINFDLSEESRLVSNDKPIVANEMDTAPLIRAGLFIVPPRKWMNKK
jgi:hypothetical protein